MPKRLLAILFLLLVLFSFVPTFYELSRQDNLRPERAFELVHNFPTDYNFYLSRIRQGIEGRVTVLEKYTSEPHQGTFLHAVYLAIGWAGRWNRVPWERGGDAYHIARFVLAVTLMLLMAQLSKKSFTKSSWQLTAFLLAVTASTWPKLVLVDGAWRFGGYMSWWSVMDSLQRITFIPHLLAGQALMLFLLMALADSNVMVRGGNWIFLGVLGFVLGIIFPPGLLFVGATAGVMVALELIDLIGSWSKKKLLPWILGRVVPRAAVVSIGAPALIYLNLMVSFYPWKRLAEFDIIKPLPFEYGEYIKALGPILPLGLLGLALALVKRDKIQRLSAAWVIAWILLLIIFRFVPQQSPLRFSEMIPHVPLGMLAAYLFYWLTRRAKVGLLPSAPPSSLSRVFYNFFKARLPARSFISVGIYFLALIIPLATIAVGLGVMYSSWLWQRDFVDHKMRATYPLVPTGSFVMYPLKDFLTAIRFIQDTTPRERVILSETTAGNYIPVYSGNTVYVGHANTVKAEEKEALVKEFFSGRMKSVAAKAWLERENLRVVFFGPQEMEDGGIGDLATVYPFLQEVYKNTYVRIYQVP